MIIRRMNMISAAVSVLAGLSVLSASMPALAAGNAAQKQWPSQSYPKQPIEVRMCSCRYAGNSIPIGKTICMNFQGRSVLAKCDSVVNSPSWSISAKECPPS